MPPTIPDSATHADTQELQTRGVSSLLLAIELFNRPVDHGRMEAVLILMHHSFEMLLKAVIVAKDGKPCVDERGYSHSFDRCLRIARDDLRAITHDQRRFLSMLDNLRDSAVHYYQVLSEDLLYLFAQGSVSLFSCLLNDALGINLRDHVPERVLPVFSRPPKNIQQLVADEFENLRTSLGNATISREQALAAIRPLVAFAIGGGETPRRMAVADVEKAIARLEGGEEWHLVFPEVAQLRIDTEEGALGFGVKIVRDESTAMPVRVVREGEDLPQGTIVAKEVNILDKFTMGIRDLAKKLGVTEPKTRMLAQKYEVTEDNQAFREIRVGSQVYRRYSKRALELLKPHVGEAEQVWQESRAQRPRKPR